MSENQTISGTTPYTGTSGINTSSTSVLNVNALSNIVALTNSLNAAISNFSGVDVVYFRALPQGRSSDVIFQEYTLYNVVDCGITLKALYTDTAYDDAAYSYSLMGLSYSSPLVLEVAFQTWNAAMDNDGTIPQRGDILYIPISNKLLEVDSMTPVKTVGAQITSFKISCSKYKPQRSRVVNDQLMETIDEYTDSVDKLFGKAISDNIVDIVDDKQLSAFTSTTKDKYKIVTPTRLSSSSRLEINSIKSFELNIGGNLVARSYYDMNVDSSVVVNYINTTDNPLLIDSRCYSAWFRNDNVNPEYRVNSIVYVWGDPTTTVYNIDTNCNKYLVNTEVVIYRGNLVLYGIITNKDNMNYTIEVPTVISNKLTAAYTNWYDLSDFKIYKSTHINLLTGSYNSADVFSFDLFANKYFILTLGGNRTVYTIGNTLKNNKWYAIIYNLESLSELNIFGTDDNNNNISKISNITLPLSWEGYKVNNMFIKPSTSYLTNIRYYNVNCKDVDEQLNDIISYNIKNDSKAIINDSADIPFNAEYFGRQV